MARDLHVDTITAIEADALRPALFVKMEFDSGDVNVWSGIGTKTMGGDDYLGVGNLGGVSQIAESTQLNANGVDFTLSGIPSAYIQLALAEPYKYKPVTLNIALLDSAGVVEGDPFILFKGRMDVMSIREGADTSMITLRSESILKALDREGGRKFSYQSHRIDYPTDLYFNQLNVIQNQELIFGPTPGREPARKNFSFRPKSGSGFFKG